MAISRNNKQEVKDHDIKVTRAVCFAGSGDIVFDAIINGISIYNMKVISYLDKKTNEKKEFFAFPQKKGNDGKYYSHCYCQLTDNDFDTLEKQISDMLN